MKHDLTAIAAPLVAWYRENRRLLPWRESKDPYRVWVSEIMLQQTRIEAVIEHYYRFMERLPSVQALSEVSEEELLKLWEGLGYYSRAKNLQKAAVQIMENGGSFPAAYEQIRQLPGIGEYTAGAIASICFQERVPAVDGNVLRVLARLKADRQNVLLPEVKKQAAIELRQIMPVEAGDFNEGLMELGETVCLPNGMPLCDRCPIRAHCAAYREGLCGELPVRIKQNKRRIEKKTVFILLTAQNEIALEKRGEKGLLAGLYQLPNVEGHLPETAVPQALGRWSLQAQTIAPDMTCKHIFTHIEWQMISYRVQVKEKNDSFEWVDIPRLREQYALPTAFIKFTKQL